MLSFENVQAYFNLFWDNSDWPTGRATQGSSPGTGKILFSPQNRPDSIWGPISLTFNEYQSSFLRVERWRREVDHSPPSSAEIKNQWSYASTPPMCFHDVDEENFSGKITKLKTNDSK